MTVGKVEMFGWVGAGCQVPVRMRGERRPSVGTRPDKPGEAGASVPGVEGRSDGVCTVRCLYCSLHIDWSPGHVRRRLPGPGGSCAAWRAGLRDYEISPLIQFQLFLFYHPTYLRPHSTKYQANDTILDYLSLHKYFRGQRQSRGLANLILLIIIIFRTGHIRRCQWQCSSVSGGLHPLHWPPLPAAVTAGREILPHHGGAGDMWRILQ